MSAQNTNEIPQPILVSDEVEGTATAPEVAVAQTGSRWTNGTLSVLVKFMHQCKSEGKITSGTVKQEMWNEAALTLNASPGASGFTAAKCKNKWMTDIKIKYKHWRKLAGQSGFGWNEGKSLFEADDDVWESLNSSFPNIIWHKSHIMYNRTELGEILENSMATGEGATAGPLLPTSTNPASPAPMATSQYNRSRKRPSPTEAAEEMTNAAKKAKVDVGAALMAVNDSIRAATQQRAESKDCVTMALELLEEKYAARLSVAHTIQAGNLFESPVKARQFLAMKDDERRDRWLEIVLRITIPSENDTSDIE